MHIIEWLESRSDNYLLICKSLKSVNTTEGE